MPHVIGAVISARLSSLADLSTVLGTEDLYMLLEILVVDRANERLLSRPH